MNLPLLPLGVRVMDEDHRAIEQMFARTDGVADADLAAHLDAIVAEIAAHFVREEAEMARVGAPILDFHRFQHAVLLDEAERIRQAFARAEAPVRRRLVGFDLAQLVANHVANVDRISCQFFDEEADQVAEA